MGREKVFLVTGATGFIGSALVRKLASNSSQVHIIARDESRFWRIEDILPRLAIHTSDLSDSGLLKKIIDKVMPDVIYHLATYGAYPHQDDIDRIIQTNILGTWNLLKATTHINYELFVNTGSSSEYGFKKSAMREGDFLEPVSYYAATKCSQTLLCCHMAREKKKPIVTLRPFSVYGPYEEPTRFIPTLMKALCFKEKISLVSPEISRDHIYVDDLVDVYLLVGRLKNFAGEIFNVGTGIQSSIKDVVEAAVRVTGQTTDFKWGEMKPRIWDTTNWVADISKAIQKLGWAPKLNLEKGLSLTWEWFKDKHHFYTKRLIEPV